MIPEMYARQPRMDKPGAIRAAKARLRHGGHSTIYQVLDHESLVFQIASQTREHYEAVYRIMETLKQAGKQ
jgi:hypothetical protein